MKMNRSATTLAVAALLGAAALPVYAYSGLQHASDAKVSMPQARRQALQQVPGSIQSAELEKESGGSGLRYSFDIRTKQGLREVGIDAVTGQVLENSPESGQSEAREARAEHEHQNKGEREDEAGNERHQPGETED